jgi:hypothetical protein
MAVNNLGYVLQYYGIQDVLIPFILVFTITFAVLQKIDLFGSKGKRFNVVIALALGLGVIIPHLVRWEQYDVVNVINTSLPNIALFLVAIIMLLVMIGTVGGKTDENSWFASIIGFVSIFAVIYIFGMSMGWFTTPYFWNYYVSNEMQTLLVVILVFGAIVYFITNEGTSPASSNAADFLKKFFKK